MRVYLFLLLLVFASAVQAADPNVMQQAYLVRQAFPAAKTVGVLCHTSHAAALVRDLKIACNAYQFDLKVFHTETLQSVREGFDRMIKQSPVDLVWVVPDDVTDQKFGRRFLSEKCLAMKFPLYVSALDHVREGALLTVSAGEDGSPRIYFNKRVGDLIGIQLPAQIQPKVVAVE